MLILELNPTQRRVLLPALNMQRDLLERRLRMVEHTDAGNPIRLANIREDIKVTKELIATLQSPHQPIDQPQPTPK